MKKHYERVESYVWSRKLRTSVGPYWNYSQRWGWGRSTCRTTGTCRQFLIDEHEIRYDEDTPRFKLRRRRNAHALDAWNIEPRNSRAYGKGWKDYTKRRKQWDKH